MQESPPGEKSPGAGRASRVSAEAHLAGIAVHPPGPRAGVEAMHLLSTDQAVSRDQPLGSLRVLGIVRSMCFADMRQQRASGRRPQLQREPPDGLAGLGTAACSGSMHRSKCLQRPG